MSRLDDLARERTEIGFALVHFFAGVRGRGLSAEEHEQALYAADDFVYRDDCERESQREMREVQR